MIKLLLDFIQFLNTLAPLLTALGVWTLIFLLLAKSIKKHAGIYYFVFAIPAILFILRQIFSSCGIIALEFSRGSIIGSILREYVHASGFSFPLLVIIMYIGALPAQNRYVKRLMMIRKELSIISGFPVLIHSWVRLRMGLGSFDYFFGSGEAVRSGAALSNAAYMLGIFMAILFLVLWVTSFDVVHKWLGGVRWKKIQRWSYVLYAMLFIHATGIQVNGMLNPRGERGTARPAVEVTATTNAVDNRSSEYQGLQERAGRSGRGGERGNRNAAQPADSSNRAEATTPAEHERGNKNAVQSANSSNHNHGNSELQERAGRVGRGNNNAVQQAAGNDNRTEAAQAGRGGRLQSPGFADITVSPQAKRYIHIASLLLIFGSYLYLRLRKAGLKKQEEQ
jgi:DMSO/TMAO reductase YedYZ heme-binding membrane subunit